MCSSDLILEGTLPARAHVFLALLAVGIFFLYNWRPLGHQFAVDAMGYALNILRDYLQERRYYAIPRQAYAGPARHSPQDNVLLVLDESVRGDYISINNPLLDTTPKLEGYLRNYPENFFNYGLMLASGTYSFLPRNVLLTGVAEMPDTRLTSQTNPTLFQIAKGNGFIDTFLESYDFLGKTIVPFATSGGSGLGKAPERMQRIATGSTVAAGRLLNGHQNPNELRD